MRYMLYSEGENHDFGLMDAYCRGEWKARRNGVSTASEKKLSTIRGIFYRTTHRMERKNITHPRIQEGK